MRVVELALRLDVPSRLTNGRTLMMKYTIGAALLVAFTAPALAGSSTTVTTGSGGTVTTGSGTTTTTGGAATSTTEQYYLVQNPTTKRCEIVTQKPTTTTTTVVGDTVYKTRTEAEGAIKKTKVCTTD